MLVPYEHLDEREKDMSRRNAVELVKAMIYFGYRRVGEGVAPTRPACVTLRSSLPPLQVRA